MSSGTVSSSELLTKVRQGARFGNIQVNDVEEVLSNELFLCRDGLLAMTEGGSTLLHLAAQSQGECVLPLVVQAYKRAQCFSEAMLMVNKSGINPLHVAVQRCRFENAVLLFRDCLELCPSCLDPDQDGWTLMHSVANSAENLNAVKYLLAQDVCRPMLLCMGKSSSHKYPGLPEDIARDLVVNSEFHLKCAEQQLSRFAQGKIMVEPKRKILEKAKDLHALIQQATLELKAVKAEERARQLERTRHLERQTQINKELEQLLKDDNWELLTNKYLLSESEETRKITVQFLVSGLEQSLSLPPISHTVLPVLLPFLSYPEDDPCVISTLKLVEGFSKNGDSAKSILNYQEEGLVSRLIYLLSTLDTHLQSVCVSIILNLMSCSEFNSDTDHLVQSLLLVKHFSVSRTTRSLSLKALEKAGAEGTSPDPGSWSVKQVSLWLHSVATEFDLRSEVIQEFKDGGIDGLHLLELSVGEMGALGVKFVSHQRRLSDKIDELRRMNMRSEVGRKDVFLSYAHIDINFARKIKTVLNSAQYSVWIDESGIRAGQKWRNEIADGIQGCGVFIYLLSMRSANSIYCQNEVAMAEEYQKPILTVKVQSISEIDPGLKFIIGHRQWIDMSTEETLQSRTGQLIEILQQIIGEGRGTQGAEATHEEDAPAQIIKQHNEPSTPGWLEIEVVRLREMMEASLSEISRRLDTLEDGLQKVTDRVEAMQL